MKMPGKFAWRVSVVVFAALAFLSMANVETNNPVHEPVASLKPGVEQTLPLNTRLDHRYGPVLPDTGGVMRSKAIAKNNAWQDRSPAPLPSLFYPELARIAVLEERPADTAFEALMPMLSDGDPVVRLAALESLADMRHPTLLPVLVSKLGDSHPLIRISAIEALVLADEHATAVHLQHRLQDDDPRVRIAAIDALGELGSEASVHLLAGLLGDANPSMRLHALHALAEIGGDTTFLYLQQMRHDSDESVRASAKAILRRPGLRIID